MSVAMISVICTAYIIVVGRMLIIHAGILYGSIDCAVAYRCNAVRRRLPRWASVAVYSIGLFIWGAAVGVVLSVVLQWYWSMW